ncbi:ATP-binding protein [Vibrio mexicanus]|uniref:ATP-binding protein n=1 Tax=Vibrio mexicanus TaxID=1004326 RepID=UPI00063CF6BD|nr:ATP-binding protein [Vibrio mexicanus]
MISQLRNISFRNKLILVFLLLSLAPMVLISSVFYSSFIKSNQQQVYENLFSLAQAKRAAINQHIETLKQQIYHHSDTDFVSYSMSQFYGFPYAFRLIAPESETAANILRTSYLEHKNFKSVPMTVPGTSGSYEQVHNRFNTGFSQFIERSEFSDILLVDLNGQVLYSYNKDAYFGSNLTSSTFSQSPLSEAFSRAQQVIPSNDPAIHGDPDKEISHFTDFRFDPIVDQMSAYFISPLNNHSRVSGYIIYVLPSQSLTHLLTEVSELGPATEVYVVNEQSQAISDLMHPLPSFYDNEIEDAQPTRLDLETIKRAQSGEEGVMSTFNYVFEPVLSAYGFVDIGDLRWSIVVEQDESQAQATSRKFGQQIILIGALFVAVVVGMIYWLSRSLTQPLDSLMNATESLTYGETLPPIVGAHRKDEIGRLASRFDVMAKAVRRQIEVINDKNKQLEEKVELIDNQNSALIHADKIKDEFLANTSHELRTPLTGVIGIGQSMMDGIAGPLETKQKQQLSIMLSGAQRLSHLVDDLLDFHKIKNNKLRVELGAVDVKRSMESVVSLSQSLLGDKELKVELISPPEKLIAYADTIRLEQVVHNLLSNAIKFTESGTITVALTQPSSQQVAISVTDTGIGIEADHHDDIFDPFTQVNLGNTRSKNGSGLGLAISSQLVTLMGGQLKVESQLGEGSCFSFDLPLIDQAQLEENHQCEGPDSTHYQWPSYASHLETDLIESNQEGQRASSLGTILVVDDEMLNLQVLHNQLSLADYQVILFTDGHQALDYLNHNRVDLIILDLMMPQISGLSMAKKIREDERLSSLPILLLTAKGQTKDLLQSFESGVDDYLRKPFLQHELLARVSHLLKANQAERNLEENRLLKLEVAKHLETEAHLKAGQGRMQQLLEKIDDAILSVNTFNQVTFANPAALTTFGVEYQELVGCDINDFIRQQDGQAFNFSQHTAPNDEQRDLSRHSTIELHFKDGKVQSVSAQLFKTGHAQNIEWHILITVSSAAHSTAAYLEQTDNACLESEYRKNLVTIMNDSLTVWQESTGGSKVTLAEQSKIWSVYLDRSSAQTRTMDKYFLEQTLPKKPRWRDVLRTASYVAHHADKTEHQDILARIASTSNKVRSYLNER